MKLDPLVKDIKEKTQEFIGIILLKVLKVVAVVSTVLLEALKKFHRIDHPSIFIGPHLLLEGIPFFHKAIFKIDTDSLKDIVMGMEAQNVTEAL